MSATAVTALVRTARPLFVGQPPEIQAAALADLVAIWLAEYTVRGDPAATERWRKDVLALHVETVRLLVAIHHKALVDDHVA